MTFLVAHAPDGLLAPRGFTGTSHRFFFKIGGRNTTARYPHRDLSAPISGCLRYLQGTCVASDSDCPHGVHPQNMPRQVKHKIMNHQGKGASSSSRPALPSLEDLDAVE